MPDDLLNGPFLIRAFLIRAFLIRVFLMRTSPQQTFPPRTFPPRAGDGYIDYPEFVERCHECQDDLLMRGSYVKTHRRVYTEEEFMELARASAGIELEFCDSW